MTDQKYNERPAFKALDQSEAFIKGKAGDWPEVFMIGAAWSMRGQNSKLSDFFVTDRRTEDQGIAY